eukprot:Filipodium_phascolosomae@DN1956_c0_g1_i1.p1
MRWFENAFIVQVVLLICLVVQEHVWPDSSLQLGAVECAKTSVDAQGAPELSKKISGKNLEFIQAQWEKVQSQRDKRSFMGPSGADQKCSLGLSFPQEAGRDTKWVLSADPENPSINKKDLTKGEPLEDARIGYKTVTRTQLRVIDKNPDLPHMDSIMQDYFYVRDDILPVYESCFSDGTRLRLEKVLWKTPVEEAFEVLVFRRFEERWYSMQVMLKLAINSEKTDQHKFHEYSRSTENRRNVRLLRNSVEVQRKIEDVDTTGKPMLELAKQRIHACPKHVCRIIQPKNKEGEEIGPVGTFMAYYGGSINVSELREHMQKLNFKYIAFWERASAWMWSNLYLQQLIMLEAGHYVHGQYTPSDEMIVPKNMFASDSIPAVQWRSGLLLFPKSGAAVAKSHPSDYRMVLTNFHLSYHQTTPVSSSGNAAFAPPAAFGVLARKFAAPLRVYRRRTVLSALDRLVHPGTYPKKFATYIPEGTQQADITKQHITRQIDEKFGPKTTDAPYRDNSFEAMYNLMAYMRYGRRGVQRQMVNCVQWLLHFDFVIAPSFDEGTATQEFSNVCSIIYTKADVMAEDRDYSKHLVVVELTEGTFAEGNDFDHPLHHKWLTYWLDRLWRIEQPEENKESPAPAWSMMTPKLHSPVHEAFPHALFHDVNIPTDVTFFEAAAEIAPFQTTKRPTLQQSMSIMKKAFPQQYLIDQMNMELGEGSG